jgi:hypothetical protein
MRIERVTDLQEIMRCLPFEREVRKKGRDKTRESDMLLFIQSQVNNPILGIWIAYDDDNNIQGYFIAILGVFPGQERVHLLRVVAKDRELRSEFEQIAKDWGKPYRAKIMTMTVSNGRMVKAIKKGYGFMPVSVNLERRM